MFITLKLLSNRHPSFIARTVFVKNNNVDDACRLLNRILGKEGILEQFRLTRYYEKPFQTRRRVNHEKCKAIYNEDMDRKIQFVLRKKPSRTFSWLSLSYKFIFKHYEYVIELAKYNKKPASLVTFFMFFKQSLNS